MIITLLGTIITKIGLYFNTFRKFCLPIFVTIYFFSFFLKKFPIFVIMLPIFVTFARRKSTRLCKNPI